MCPENFSELQHRGSIAADNKIYSAAQDGKIPFVSAEDIAAVASRALTDPVPHNTDHVILGPELLTYDDVGECGHISIPSYLSSLPSKGGTNVKDRQSTDLTRL